MVKSAESVDESEVIREALGGSPIAFGQIVRRYQGDVRMFVATWIRCPAATDDIAQEVFVAGLGTEELRRLKTLEEENKRLKSLVTELSLDKQILQDVLSEKL